MNLVMENNLIKKMKSGNKSTKLQFSNQIITTYVPFEDLVLNDLL